MNTFRRQHGKTIIRMDILPPERKAGSVFRAPQRHAEVVDAQFEPVQERRGSTRAPRSHNDNRKSRAASAGMAAPCLAHVEAVLKRLPPDAFSALVAAAFVAVFALAGGFSFLFQNAAAVEAAPAFDITHVSMVPQDADGMRVLLINGIVENRGSDKRAMPSIRADLISGEVVLASTMINPPQGVLEGRQSRGFTAKVPHPGGKLPDLRLSVAGRGVSGS
ncbi:hypothetical protein EPK99_24725 [Neorhizobium lilium]|uniref:DUF3426 domain-containing protein n=1 Tax=Neorhizobium lilium TaxID=2503024 RepID=A0A3S3VDV9_9HYPH|nr:hypothetical protein [Neorhizobium lilium]RWX74394.1 hypothetical protein EPK99_24725 [Neorhizobium lilium]